MKNKVSDVRNHLVAMLEQLGDPDVGPEVIERAKASALVAGTYISAVKVEIDALRLADDIGKLPDAVAAPAPPTAPTSRVTAGDTPFLRLGTARS